MGPYSDSSPLLENNCLATPRLSFGKTPGPLLLEIWSTPGHFRWLLGSMLAVMLAGLNCR
jgi:hypothetical protein